MKIDDYNKASVVVKRIDFIKKQIERVRLLESLPLSHGYYIQLSRVGLNDFPIISFDKDYLPKFKEHLLEHFEAELKKALAELETI